MQVRFDMYKPNCIFQLGSKLKLSGVYQNRQGRYMQSLGIGSVKRRVEAYATMWIRTRIQDEMHNDDVGECVHTTKMFEHVCL